MEVYSIPMSLGSVRKVLEEGTYGKTRSEHHRRVKQMRAHLFFGFF
ncbi:hypothetical protein [Proteiniclasticum ruminis]|uniref:Uncharacterized protein n=1 Tax=Proteiniclasticum ruminis TaxID=398199 RepID=A0A1I5A3K3_9CLOT|nr:hypothetical protein [Proteiniclasticum ruminis]SFN57085.1 hypothetical protein SAMN04488695_102304 [Proteiniclasticum ruminis]